MTIISKSKKCVVNFDNVEKIYVSGDNVSIKADMKSGRGTELAIPVYVERLLSILSTGQNSFALMLFVQSTIKKELKSSDMETDMSMKKKSSDAS